MATGASGIICNNARQMQFDSFLGMYIVFSYQSTVRERWTLIIIILCTSNSPFHMATDIGQEKGAEVCTRRKSCKLGDGRSC